MDRDRRVRALLALATGLALAASAAARDDAAVGEAGPDAAVGVQAAPGAQAGAAGGEAGPTAQPAATAPDPDAKLDAYPGVILRVLADGILVRRAGRPSDPRAPPVMAFVGALGVPVEGQGKNSWIALRRGDLVMVSYVKGPPHRVAKVNVLPHPMVEKTRARVHPPKQRRQRTFVGYIKKVEGDELIVMSPPAPAPVNREAEIKAFVRTPETEVGVLRESWDELRKGDRVRIGHQKGNPRPIDVVQVIRKGGEEPLPPGLATRLFHPDYDRSVRDVDGIGEVRRRRAGQRLPALERIRLNRKAAD